MTGESESEKERTRLQGTIAGFRQQARCIRRELESVRGDIESLAQARGR